MSLGIQGKQSAHHGFRGGRSRHGRTDFNHSNDASISGPTRIHQDDPQANPDIPTDVSHSHDINNSFLNFQPDGDDKFDCFKSRGLHFFHLNTQSLLPKLSEVKISG